MTGEDIQILRDRLGVSQTLFSRLLNRSNVSVNRWENDKSSPSGLSKVLLRLLRAALDHNPRGTVLRNLQSVRHDDLALVLTLVRLGNNSEEETCD